jgi:succinate-acetate transporter protein
VVLTSIALVMHPRAGGKASAAVLANAPIGLIGFGFACSVLHFTAERFGNPGGLALALLTSLAWSLLMMLAHRPPAAELT